MNKENLRISEKNGKIDSLYLQKTIIQNVLVLILILVILDLMVILSLWGASLDDNSLLPLYEKATDITLLLSLIIVVLGFVIISLYTKAYMNRFSYGITDKFIVIYSGVFTSEKTTIPFSRIQNITLHQGIIDKIFRLYNVKIETAGSSLSVVHRFFSRSEGFIPGIRDPSPLEGIINKLVNKYTQEPYRNLQGREFENADLAFDEFSSYFLRKLQEGSDTQNQIEKIRTEKKISREELANKIGVSRQTIYYLEKGKYQPSLKIAMLLEETLGVSIQEMFVLTDSDRKNKKE